MAGLRLPHATSRIVAFSGALALALILETCRGGRRSARCRPPLESVTVTATRIIRDGYEAPTPTTVLGADIPDTCERRQRWPTRSSRLPQMRNAADEGTGSLMFGGAAGRGFVNLRGLGTNRTLVLLDGERPVSNTLVRRSGHLVPAVGADHSGGRRHRRCLGDLWIGCDRRRRQLPIDSRFRVSRTASKAAVSRNPMPSARKVTAAWGGSFGDRWHLVASAEIFDRTACPSDSRSFATPPAIVPNPGFTSTNGQRPLHVVRNAYDADQAPGGLILMARLPVSSSFPTAHCALCALFLHGEPALRSVRFSRQDLAATLGTVALTSPQRRAAGFGRLTFQITPDLEARFDALVARNRTAITSVPLETNCSACNCRSMWRRIPFCPKRARPVPGRG